MHDGKGKCLHSISSVETASVAVGLLLIVLACLDIYDAHLLCHGGKVGDGRKVCY